MHAFVMVTFKELIPHLHIPAGVRQSKPRHLLVVIIKCPLVTIRADEDHLKIIFVGRGFLEIFVPFNQLRCEGPRW